LDFHLAGLYFHIFFMAARFPVLVELPFSGGSGLFEVGGLGFSFGGALLLGARGGSVFFFDWQLGILFW
jgi:hypothetical protein